MKRGYDGQVLIECPDTIFLLYVSNEDELSKIGVFMNNLRALRKVGLQDIYNWCNRQGIMYDTKFNYHRDFTLIKTLRSYFKYFTLKRKYGRRLQPV